MKKRFLILGAGAIGSYLGGSLAQNGHEVLFLEREKDITSLQNQGIIMDIEGKRSTISSPKYISSLDQALNQKPDLIILAVKTYHLDTILPELTRLRENLPPLLCLQNGVESEKRLADALGSELVIPGTVTSAVDCPSKGNIIVRKMRGMGVAGSHPIVKDLVKVFLKTEIYCKYYPNPDSMKWSKLVTNLLGNSSSAILNLSPAQIYSNPALYKVEIEQVREALNVMHIQGIKAVNLPGVPVKILAALIKYLPYWLSQPLLSRMIGSGRGKKMPSFHIDLYSGKKQSEVNQLNGAVVRAGEKSRIPTPVNSFLTDTLLSLINREIPLETFNQGQEEFLSQLAASKMEI
jgi:2-dehydropantoate 2-reductase